MSTKSADWAHFAIVVRQHILLYVIPQYGDKGNDECADYTKDDLIKQIKKYTSRQGKNSRPGQDELDLLKIAHYAQMAYTMIAEEKEDAKKE